MRVPSLHINEEDLIKILKKINYSHSLKKLKPKELAVLILTNSKPYSCNHRSISITNEKMERKAKTIIQSSKGDAMMLASIIYTLRKKKKHKGIAKLNEANRDWGQVKKLAGICVQFCNEFNLPRRKGFIEYITLGMSSITSTRGYLIKLINMQEKITNDYDFKLQVQDDKNPQETKLIYEYYADLIMNKTGIDIKYDMSPEKYIKFIEIREITDKMDIPFDIYIDSQFDGLSWTGNYPQPNQLVGEKAIERLNKFLYEKKLKIKKDKPTKNNVNVLKRIANGVNNNRNKES